MTHSNRGRVTVALDGNWRLYTNTLPAGAAPLGTVTRDKGDTGALARIEATGAYVQVNAGVLRPLDGRKVAAAMGTAGRPTEMHGGRRRNIYIDDASWQRAQELGDGNASDGIRIAIQRAEPTA